MAVKSVFDIKCFKDVKFWVEQSVLHYTNPKTFFKISFPPCASKSFGMYMCYCILHIVWKWLAGTRGGGGGGGGEDVQQPKNPGLKPIKCLFYQIKNY